MGRDKRIRKNKTARRRYKRLQRAWRETADVAIHVAAKLRAIKTELTRLPPGERACCLGCTLPAENKRLVTTSGFVAEPKPPSDKVKAISVKQPWASMIARGQKNIETRTWSTKYRGEIYIASSKKADMVAMLDLSGAGVINSRDPMPQGFALCVANLVDCRPMTEEDEAAACCKVYPEASSWVLENIRKITPFPVKGQLGIYEIQRRVK